MKGADKIDKAIDWVDEYALVIVGVIGGFIYLIDMLETHHFVLVVVTGVIIYLIYIIFEKRKYLEETDVVLK